MCAYTPPCYLLLVGAEGGAEAEATATAARKQQEKGGERASSFGFAEVVKLEGVVRTGCGILYWVLGSCMILLGGKRHVSLFPLRVLHGFVRPGKTLKTRDRPPSDRGKRTVHGASVRGGTRDVR